MLRMAGTQGARGTVNVRLRCSSWPQLVAIYRRDIVKGSLFIRAAAPPPLGTVVAIRLILPSGSSVDFAGTVASVIAAGDAGPRGPGVRVALADLSSQSRVVLENAVKAAAEHQRRTAAPAAREAAAKEPLSSDAGAPLLAAEEELAASLESELETLLRFNRFQVLGIGYSASDAEVRAAFAELSRRYHPDRFLRYQNPRISELAEALFVTAREAYQALSDAALRDAERDRIRSRRAPSVPGLLRQVARARTEGAEPTAAKRPRSGPDDPMDRFPEARALLDAGDHAGLVDFFVRAVQGNPGEVAARVGLDLALGVKALASGDRLEAVERLLMVLERQPDNELAARELAVLKRHASSLRQEHLSMLHDDREEG